MPDQPSGKITLSGDLAGITSVHIQSPPGWDAAEAIAWAARMRDALSTEISEAMTCPYHEGINQTAEISASGPVNGMGEPDTSGAYVLVSVSTREGSQKLRISRGAAEVLMAEIAGVLGG